MLGPKETNLSFGLENIIVQEKKDLLFILVIFKPVLIGDQFNSVLSSGLNKLTTIQPLRLKSWK